MSLNPLPLLARLARAAISLVTGSIGSGAIDRVLDSLDRHGDRGLETDKLKTRLVEKAIDAQTDRLRIHAAMPPWHPMMIIGYVVAAFVFKLIVIDTMLGWSVTHHPGDVVLGLLDTVVKFYFGAAGAIGVAALLPKIFGGR
ncbi:MAG: hypothetical protein AAGH43_06070 [Pseudomonadota bacterium]